MPCAWGHTTYHADCDACDAHSSDPNTGWGGFHDHFAGRSFRDDEEQAEYYRQARLRGDDGLEDEDDY